MSHIRKKFLFQLIYAFSQLAFPLLTYPYITRTIGAEGLGLVSYIEYVSGFIITIASFGIPMYGVREIARLQNDEEKKAAVLRRLFSFHLFVSLLGCMLFVAFVKANPQQAVSTPLLLLGCINIILPAFVAEWYMQGIEAFAFTTIRSIVLRFLGLVALFLFVNHQQDYVIYYLVIILVQAAVAATNIHKVGWKMFIPTFDHNNLPVTSLWHFFISSSLISVYVFFDILILGWVADEANVGYYTVAVRLVKLSLLLVLSLNVILFPRISYLKSSHSNNEEVKALTKKSMEFLLVLTIPIVAGFYFLAPQIIAILAGDKFHPSIKLVQILSVLPLIIGFSNLFVYQILTPFGREKKLLYAVIITCSISLLLHVVFATLWVERGTAVATLCTELIMTLLTAVFAFQTFRFRFPIVTMLQTLAAISPFILLVLFCNSMFSNPWLLIVTCGTIGAAIYFAIQYLVFRNLAITEAVNELKRLNRRIGNG